MLDAKKGECMKKITKFLLIGIIVLTISGCFEEEFPFKVENTIDLQSPNGIYEVLLFNGVKEAFEKIDWGKYKSKNIYFEVQKINDGYLDNVVSALVEHKFLESQGNILTISQTGENKEKTYGQIKKESNYDYDIYITVPISGVYFYEGFFKRQYIAYVMLNLFEKQKDKSEYKISSGLIEKKFDKFIPSKIFVTSIWILIIAVIILLILKILFKKHLTRQSM